MSQRNCFTELDTKRYDSTNSKLRDGEYIEVKKFLNTGEQLKQDALAMVPKKVDGKVYQLVDWSEYEILRAALWLVGWHIHDKEGKVPELSVDSIKALDFPVFQEINEIIFNHAEESAKLKKASSKLNGAYSTPQSQ